MQSERNSTTEKSGRLYLGFDHFYVVLCAGTGHIGSMKKPISFPRDQSADPVSLASMRLCWRVLISVLPTGTAFFVGVVLIVMMTGRLVHHKAAWPVRPCLLWCICLGLAPRRAGDGPRQGGP